VEKLMPQYFRGELASPERDEFIQAVLEDQELYNSFAEQAILKQLMSDPDIRARIEREGLAAPGQRRRWFHIFRPVPMKWRFAMAVLVLAFVISPLVLIDRFTGKAPSTSSSISLFLFPAERGSSADTPILHLPPQNRAVILNAPVSREWSGTYSAVLDGPSRAEMAWKGLRSAPGSNGSEDVTVRFSSNLLGPGNYTLTLYASEDGSRLNPVASYAFLVEGSRR
jgi:hypothetical protein